MAANARGARGERGWYRDPVGRHEYRYWDGTHWTHAAADHGVPIDDPLPSATWIAATSLALGVLGVGLLVLAVVLLAPVWLVPWFVCSVLAMIFGGIGLDRAAVNRATAWKVTALAGLILGALMIALMVLSVILVILALISASGD